MVTSGQKELRSDWPIEEGLEAGTTKRPDKVYLDAENDLTSKNDKVGLY